MTIIKGQKGWYIVKPIVGIIMIVCAGLIVYFEPDGHFLLAFFIFSGFANFFQYWLLRRYGVMRYDDTIIETRTWIRPLKIRLNNIKNVEYKAGDYIITGEGKKLTINKEAANKEDLAGFISMLQQINPDLQPV